MNIVPTLKEVESDIITISATLLSNVTTMNDIINNMGIEKGIEDTKQFEKGINKQILKFEELRTRVRMLKKLRSKK